MTTLLDLVDEICRVWFGLLVRALAVSLELTISSVTDREGEDRITYC
jgi:hypothetical protein